MSDQPPAAPTPQPGPDDALLGERFQVLCTVDEIDRQLRDLARSRRNLTQQRGTLQARLDEIAAELKGRRAARQAAAAPKDQ